MKNWPKTSIIVLNYNGAQHLEPCFKSLTALDYPADRLELVCVDNGSSDGSVELMQETFPHVRLIETGANLGFAEGNNVGARQATGTFVAFLNNDTRVPANWLKTLIQPCLREPNVICSGSKIVSWDGQKLEFGGGAMNCYGYGFQEGFTSLRPQDHAIQKDTLYACGGAMAIQRDVFVESGGFDPDFFAFYEDSDLGWRLWLLGYRVVFSPQSVVYHRHHATASTIAEWKRRLLYERNALFTIVKNYDDENLARVLPAALLLLLKRARHMTGAQAAEYLIEPERTRPDYAAQPPDTPWTPLYYAKKAAQTLLQDGPAALATRVKEELGRRQEPVYPPPHIQRPNPSDPNFEQVPRDAIAHLLAADDLIRYWPRLMEKRVWIQSQRRREDKEILALFGKPLEANFFNDEYKMAQAVLGQAFQIDQLFKKEEK